MKICAKSHGESCREGLKPFPKDSKPGLSNCHPEDQNQKNRMTDVALDIGLNG